MHEALSGDGGRRSVVLCGLGGIGKTQLSVAYAKRYKDSYSAIFWLNTKDEQSLKQSFSKAARQILREHPSDSRLTSIDTKKDLDETIDAVNSWLSLRRNTRWLMIFDNYDNPKLLGVTDPAALDILEFFPESYQGSVIITTRSSQVKIGRRIHITKLQNVRDSLEILSTTSFRERLINDLDAIRLAEELDGLPLALATAGAYLDQVAISLSDYHFRYKESWAKLQKASPRLMSYTDQTLYSTWQLSFDNVKQQNELSAKLLCLWAYFDNQDLWFELLQHAGSEDPGWIQELAQDELSFHSVVRVLSDHGLVEVDKSSLELAESRGYSIHGCVHLWTIHVLNQKWDYDLARVAVKFVGLHVPEQEDPRPWLTQRRLLQHAARCSYIVLNGLVTNDSVAEPCHRLGTFYASQGKLDIAKKMYERALHDCEKAVGLDHISTLNIVRDLSNVYSHQGKLDIAEKMYKWALYGYEEAGGLDHISTLNTVSNLGNLYVRQGKLDAAKKMYERALRGYQKAADVGHISALNIANNFGIRYVYQGKLDAAEKMYEQALHGKEKAFGLDHILTLRTVSNLGNLYTNQGKLEAAEKMLERALRGYEKALGLVHISTLRTVSNLGILYANQGKLDAAERMYKRALHGDHKGGGLDHISMLNTASNLGTLYKRQGKFDAAKEMYEQVLHGKEKVFGLDHISTLDTINNLGNIYNLQGKLNAAKNMYEQALNGYEKLSVTTHIPALNTVENLARLLSQTGRLEEAKEYYLRAQRGHKTLFGDSDQKCKNIAMAIEDLDKRKAV